MNCAEVNVISGATRRRRRQAYNSFDSLPYIWKANLEGLNDCATTEGVDPVYPEPGPDVQYGNGASSSSTPSSGTCDSSTPYGQTYKDLGDSSTTPSIYNSTVSILSEKNSSSTSTVASYAGSTGAPSYGINKAAVLQNKQKLAASAQSTTTVWVDCSSTVTITIPTTAFITAMASSSPPQVVTSAPAPSPTANTGSGSGGSSSTPPYATDVSKYSPCVPGTFICTDANTWQTCDYNAAQQWVYKSPRTVAAGMMCLPYLSTYTSSNKQYAQQANVASGSYRDDRIVRTTPDGDCSQDGSLQCTGGGTTFDICDQGGWVQMGSVAAGTKCSNRAIVAA